MLTDPRLGGQLPPGPRIAPRRLSRESCLAVRITSPHEMDESLDEFIQKIDRATEVAWGDFWRINYASAIQPRPFKQMPGIVDVCARLKREFSPERIRVVQLAPDQSEQLTSQLTNTEIDGLRRNNVEVISMDARRSSYPAEPGNVRILADFFYFP